MDLIHSAAGRHPLAEWSRVPMFSGVESNIALLICRNNPRTCFVCSGKYQWNRALLARLTFIYQRLSEQLDERINAPSPV